MSIGIHAPVCQKRLFGSLASVRLQYSIKAAVSQGKQSVLSFRLYRALSAERKTGEARRNLGASSVFFMDSELYFRESELI